MGPPPVAGTLCLPFFGAQLCLPSILVDVPVLSSAAGSSTLTLTLPSSFVSTGQSVGIQTLFLNAPGCVRPFSSSATLIF